MAKCTQRNNSDKPEIYQRQRQVFCKQQAHICDNYKTYNTVNSKESLNTQQTLAKMNNVLRFLDNKLASSVATTMITTAREEEYDGLYTTLKPFE